MHAAQFDPRWNEGDLMGEGLNIQASSALSSVTSPDDVMLSKLARAVNLTGPLEVPQRSPDRLFYVIPVLTKFHFLFCCILYI